MNKAQSLLHVSDLTVRFGGLIAVNEVSLQVQESEICALIGPNGAGKTSLFNAIAGYVPVISGRVLYRGRPIQGLTPHEIAGRGVRRTFQNGGLFGDLTVLENVLVGMHGQVGSDFFGTLLGSPRSARAENDATARARQLLALMDLTHVANQPAKSLSGGQQRMVEIVRAIATNPPLLLLDEPAVGLAPAMRQQLGTIIRGLARDRRIGILLIEHAIELVMDISDRVVVLNYGRKVADGSPQEIRTDRNVLEAYLGHA
ncbi:MAG TPA: ABC transporter ATP-binding protein [Acetobacteraceae bacterium]|nr:ABC transporter ATP-binding protein [Acetobacteraceae bacterium]